MVSEEERKALNELMREMVVLNAALNEYEKTFSRVRNEYFELHKKIDAKLNGQ